MELAAAAQRLRDSGGERVPRYFPPAERVQPPEPADVQVEPQRPAGRAYLSTGGQLT